ncbi:unnamed protein product [Closterium sp. Naga37s-1]|nr:unnamed protein product [Closterium sp. Naga37s-1]
MRYEAVILQCTLQAPTGPISGGRLVMAVDGREAVVVQEEPGHDLPHAMRTHDFPHALTHCSSPLYKPTHAGRLREWMDFHRTVHRVDLFLLYDAGGVDGAVRHALHPLLAGGTVQIADLRDAARFESYHHAQGEGEGQGQRGGEEGWTWVSFGCFFFSVDRCAPLPDISEGDEWAVERMVYRDPAVIPTAAAVTRPCSILCL